MKNDENITLQEGEDGIRKENKVEGEKALYSCYPATTVNMYPCRGGSSCELAFCHHQKKKREEEVFRKRKHKKCLSRRR